MPRTKNTKIPQIVKIVKKKYNVPPKVNLPDDESIHARMPIRFKKPNKLPQTNKEIIKKVKIPDPFITILQNIIDDSGMDAVKIAVKAAQMGRAISWKTVNNLITGQTSRPQHFTCESIIIACGQEILIRPRTIGLLTQEST